MKRKSRNQEEPMQEETAEEVQEEQPAVPRRKSSGNTTAFRRTSPTKRYATFGRHSHWNQDENSGHGTLHLPRET